MDTKRRRFLNHAGLAMGALAGSMIAGSASASIPRHGGGTASTDVDTHSLDDLHGEALEEGGRLVVYAGGDSPNGYASLERAYRARFPGLDIRIVTDLSKYHDVRIDRQRALGHLECDVAHLQTLHDFARWKSEGALLSFKPSAWNAIEPSYKDPDGYFVAVDVFAFANVFNTDLIVEHDAPRDAIDYLDPSLRNRLTLVYPHDDDAVLLHYAYVEEDHGWGYMKQLLGQNVAWRRGTELAAVDVDAGRAAATFGVTGPLQPPADARSRFLLPRHDRFVSWPQTGAIFAQARHKAAARLYMSWLLDKQTVIDNAFQWPPRTDVPVPAGYDHLDAYRTSHDDFRNFISDRRLVASLKQRFERLIGPVRGPNPTGIYGLYVA
jgi:ABC-type Fe3+ transport system substrate-binding protein